MRCPPILAMGLCTLLAGCFRSPVATESTSPNTPRKQSQTSTKSWNTQSGNYVGTWAAKDDQGDPFNIIVFPNGQAVTTWVKGTAGARGERGFWRIEGNNLTVFTMDGWTDQISPDNGGFLHSGFAPDNSGKAASNQSPTEQLDKTAAEYVGVWRLNREPDGTFLYITLQTGGRAYSTINGKTEGTWETTDKGALCKWPDGWMDLFMPGKDGYQKRSWVGTEENETADISAATRVGESRYQINP